MYPVTAADVMLRDVPSLVADAPWRDAVPILLKDAHVALPVLDRGGRVVGILTRADLAVRVGGMERTELRAVLDCAVLARSFGVVTRWHDRETRFPGVLVASLMTAPVVTVHARMSLRTVAMILFSRDIAQVPVTDGVRRLVGMIRRYELIAALAGEQRAVFAIPRPAEQCSPTHLPTYESYTQITQEART